MNLFRFVTFLIFYLEFRRNFRQIRLGIEKTNWFSSAIKYDLGNGFLGVEANFLERVCVLNHFHLVTEKVFEI